MAGKIRGRGPLSDIEIAQAAQVLPIAAVAAKLGIPAAALEPYGSDKAKLSLEYLAGLQPRPDSRLILVGIVGLAAHFT